MAISRRALFGKLNLTLFRALESATTFAKLRGNPYVELTHWLHQLWQLNDSDLHRILRHCKVDSQTVDHDLTAALSTLPAGSASLSDFSHHLGTAVERAWILSSLEFGDRRIRSGWLLAALVRTSELRSVLLGVSNVFRKIPIDVFDESLAAIIAGSPEEKENAHHESGLAVATPGEAAGALIDVQSDKSALLRYCSDLTARARAGEIDPVIGREHEIRTMVDILLRRRQNNPLLTGEAGVGKTAVVEGLALAIARSEVPPILRDVRLLSLDLGALLAGASMRGEFESRLKTLLEEADRSPRPVILLVDEVHALVGAGGQTGTGDAANLLKPALARGTLRTVGATTWSEYKRHIEKDPALTRRFQVLQVAEPKEASAIEMVRGMAPTFAVHHDVTVLDEAVRTAVILSHRYIPSRQLPDKAISLLDTACARVAMSLHSPPATVQYLRQRMAALQTELELLVQEDVIAESRVHRAERKVAVEVKKSSLSNELVVQEARWQDELKLVERIHALRKTYVNDVSNESAPSETFAELTRLESDLIARQRGAPLIHLQVDAAVVAAIVADWTGIPVGRMVQDDAAAVFDLHATLNRRVRGQTDALNTIVERVQVARACLTDPEKPVGVFLLVGPSGVGKTETALALAEAMYGGEQNLITINMSEFQEPHTVSTLKGAPPGYVGYGEGGVLTEAVRRRPYSVILLDEVEKAHPDVHEIFYQVFDKGWMEDGEGRFIDFRNTIILLTSNTGSEVIARLYGESMPAPDAVSLNEALQPELRRIFPASFIGRISVVPYLPLAQDALESIALLQLDRVADRMRVSDVVPDTFASTMHGNDAAAKTAATVDVLLDPPVHVLAPEPSKQQRLAAIKSARNPLLEAAQPLLRALADMPVSLEPDGVIVFHRLLEREVVTFESLGSDAQIRHEHVVAASYALCTALDEAAGSTAWGGGKGADTGVWAGRQLAPKFHGDNHGGDKFFLLVGRLAISPQEHTDLLELMHQILGLGYEGRFNTAANGRRQLEAIRHRLLTLLVSARGDVPNDLSAHWRGAGTGKFRLMRSIPVWVTAAVLSLVLLGLFGWYKYQLLRTSADVEQRIAAIGRLRPPPAPPVQPMRLKELLSAEIARGTVSVDEDDHHSALTFKGDDMFVPGQARVNARTVPVLVKVADEINQVSGSVQVTGHSDNLPIRTREFPDNQALSEKRAAAVAQVLQDQGVSASRLKVEGRGDTAPVADNATSSGRARNRRVDIVVTQGTR